MVYSIAEIGANHNGSMAEAQKLVAEAQKAGADAVKFQSWTPDSLYAKQYLRENPGLRHELIKYSLSIDKLKYLAKHTTADFICSVFSEEEVDDLYDTVDLYKIASMDLTNKRLLQHVASKKKPVIISTGMGTLDEVRDAVYIFRRLPVTVLHCVSLYPPQYDQINLGRMEELRGIAKRVGYSDHTTGTVIPLAAVALGATMVEMHFTLDKRLPGWDHKISKTPEEFAKFVLDAEAITLAKRKAVLPDKEAREAMRRSLVTARDIYKGEEISDKDTVLLRPGYGMQRLPQHRTARRDIPAGTILTRDDFE